MFEDAVHEVALGVRARVGVKVRVTVMVTVTVVVRSDHCP